MAATFLGCFLIYTLPDWVSAQINKQMPYWFYEREVCAPVSVMDNAICQAVLPCRCPYSLREKQAVLKLCI